MIVFSEISLDNDNVPVWKSRNRDRSRQSKRNDIKTRARPFENCISVRRYVSSCRDDFIRDSQCIDRRKGSVLWDNKSISDADETGIAFLSDYNVQHSDPRKPNHGRRIIKSFILRLPRCTHAICKRLCTITVNAGQLARLSINADRRRRLFAVRKHYNCYYAVAFVVIKVRFVLLYY